MKTVSVRVKTAKVARLREVAEYIPGSSINVLVDRAIDQFLEIEAPVYIAAFKEARDRLDRRERQPVGSEGVRQ